MAVLFNKKFNNYYIDTKIKRKDGSYYHFKYQDNKNINFKNIEYVKCIEKEIIDNKKKELNNEMYYFNSLINSYIEYIKVDIKESTLRTYRFKIKNYIIPFFNKDNKEIEVSKIFNSSKILEFRNYVGSKNIVSSSKNKIIHILKSLIIYSKYLKIISSDLKDDLLFILKPFKEENVISDPLNRYTSIEDLKKLISVINNKNHKVLLLSLYFSASRIGEFLGIKVKDIEIFDDHLEILLKRQKGEDDKTLIDSLKTRASYKRIYYFNPIKDLILEYIKDNDLKEEDLLFNYTRNNIRRILDKYLAKCNLPHNTLHGFMRKSINTEMYLKTKDIKLCTILLGQASEDCNLVHYVASKEYEKEVKSNLNLIYNSLNN